MGTFVVLAVLIAVVALIVRGIKKTKTVTEAAFNDNHKFQVIRRAWF